MPKSKNHNDQNALKVRIEALLDSVELEAVTDSDLASDFSIAEMSGATIPTRYRKLAILRNQDLVTKAEQEQFIDMDISAVKAGEKKPDEIFKID